MNQKLDVRVPKVNDSFIPKIAVKGLLSLLLTLSGICDPYWLGRSEMDSSSVHALGRHSSAIEWPRGLRWSWRSAAALGAIRDPGRYLRNGLIYYTSPRAGLGGSLQIYRRVADGNDNTGTRLVYTWGYCHFAGNCLNFVNFVHGRDDNSSLIDIDVEKVPVLVDRSTLRQ